MENGWSRLHSSSIYGSWPVPLSPTADPLFSDCSWLSQANHVFSQLAIPPKPEDYSLEFSALVENLSDGYLFLCPLEDLRSKDRTWIATTKCPAYWSSIPPEAPDSVQRMHSGLDSRLSNSKWNCFHVGKGFNLNSQDIARQLGHPIFELCCISPNVDGARIEEVSSNCLETQLDPRDAPYTQRFKFMIGGVLGLILVLVMAWS
ncbi:hypothetical protein C8R44DRAFT_746127 [Mycena epipterygia]|nr:hypothetical protein C8R44DRAFT_746127 [Mycena epipterygia]